MADLLERVGDSLNSRAIESLVRCGAFDFTGYRRSQMIATIQESIACAAARRKDKESGQTSLFDMLGGEDAQEFNSVEMPDLEELDFGEMLKDEKHLLGFYISGHPAQKYQEIIEPYSTMNAAEIQESGENDQGVKLGGLMKSVQKKISKKNNKTFAIIEVEDMNGSVEGMLFGEAYDQAQQKNLLQVDTPVFVTAVIRRGEEENAPASLTIRSIIPLEDVMKTSTEQFHIHLYELDAKPELMPQLKELLLRHNGTVPTVLCVCTANGRAAFVELPEEYSVAVTPALLADLRNLLKGPHYKIKANMEVPKPKPRYVPKEKPAEQQA